MVTPPEVLTYYKPVEARGKVFGWPYLKSCLTAITYQEFTGFNMVVEYTIFPIERVG